MVKNEFRYNVRDKHKQYVFLEQDGKYKAVGITHQAETFGKRNMPLKKNPQQGKSEIAYIRNGIISASKKSYGKKPLKNYSFSTEDFPKVKAKIRNYKKRRKKRTSSGG